MVTATPPPKPRNSRLLFLSYVYAATLAVIAVVQLMGLGGFDFGGIAYQTPGLPGLVVVIAGLQIFALPFLLRLSLSPLARFFSATFALIAPLFMVAHLMYLIAEAMVATDWLAILGSILLVGVGLMSFINLDGARALRFPKR